MPILIRTMKSQNRQENKAEEMVPRLERDIMQELGFADPYLNDEE